MSPPKPEERRRRYHKRSRNGCVDCKRKHIRCDEKKPLCTNCLVKGDSCGYADTRDESPQPSSIKLEEDEYWDSDTAAPMQSMHSNQLLVSGYQAQVPQGDAAGYQYNSYGQPPAAAQMAQDALSRQAYWGQSVAPNVPTTPAMSYTMGSQQQQMYNWRDVPAIDPATGQPTSYWSQDPNQQDPTAQPPPPADQGTHRGSKHSSRKDGGRSRR